MVMTFFTALHSTGTEIRDQAGQRTQPVCVRSDDLPRRDAAWRPGWPPACGIAHRKEEPAETGNVVLVSVICCGLSFRGSKTLPGGWYVISRTSNRFGAHSVGDLKVHYELLPDGRPGFENECL